VCASKVRVSFVAKKENNYKKSPPPICNDINCGKEKVF